MEQMKRCATCAREVGAEVTRCPHCQGWQPEGGRMHRGGEGRVLLGVCLALARQLGVEVALVRVAFVVALAVTGGTALLVYLLLWGFTPPSALGKAPVQQVVGWFSQGTQAEPKPPQVERRV